MGYRIESGKNSDELASPIERAKRTFYIRKKLLKLTREQLQDRYQIPKGTIQNWETARHGGLSEKGAEKLAQVCLSEGFVCEISWLLEGIGSPPKSVNQPVTEYNSEKAAIAKELELFHSLYRNAVDFIIIDDAMEPILIAGDFVAGVRYFNDEIAKAVNQICIVQTVTGNTLVRKVKHGSLRDHYILSSINSNTTTEQPILSDIQLFSAAPIMWIRKPILTALSY